VNYFLCVMSMLSVYRCTPGFIGEYCQHRDPCYRDYCQNGGKCLINMKGIPGSPSCSCALGFTGQRCETPQNSPCYPSNPCANQGQCALLALDDYQCHCTHGWIGQGYSYFLSFPSPTIIYICLHLPVCPSGRHCEKEDSCLSSPCASGGTCTVLGEGKYFCNCPPGYQGPRCLNDTDECYPSENQPCQNGGKCVNVPGSYRCSCPVGQFCTDDVDECRLQPNTCQNGGTCSNSVGGYNCVCVNGWSGPDCSENIDDCATALCSEGSTCIDRVASFICNCPYGKTGLLCHVPDACISDPCREGSNCYTNPINGMYNCNCQTGYKGSTCHEDIDECIIGVNPCEHFGQCLNTDGSFTCNCLPGYTGPRCEQDVNECLSNPCKNDATCLDQIGKYTCICMPGVQIQECLSNPCQNGGRCIDLVNQYKCVCLAGTSGKSSYVVLEGPQACAGLPTHYAVSSGHAVPLVLPHSPCWSYLVLSQNFKKLTRIHAFFPCDFSGDNCENNDDDCASNPCIYGECHDGINEYSCVCSPGYTGKKCDVDIDECQSNPCLGGGTCEDKVNGFNCLCPPGTHRPLCHSGEDHCAPQPCVHGLCVEKQDGYHCECKPGWVGQHCDQDRDECLANPCHNGATCHDGRNSYTCKCSPGFSGVNCQINVDECESNPCLNQGTCVDGVNGYTCLCALPYTGRHCEEDLEPCKSHPCHNGGVCQPSLDYTSFVCQCSKGWQGMSVSECVRDLCCSLCNAGTDMFVSGRCRSSVRRCLQKLLQVLPVQTTSSLSVSDPCLNGGTCVDKVGRYSCECRSGFFGDRCEEEVDECASSPCRKGGQCQDFVNSYVCTCQPGFEGLNCERSAPHSCLNNGTCVEGLKTFTCHCRPGFTGPYCQYEINECDSQPCKNGGTCMDGLGSYRCTCPLDHARFIKTHMVDSLSSVSLCVTDISVEKLCQHAGRCEDTGKTHKCHCQAGYTGNYCETEVNECLSNPCRNSATCVDYQGGYECKCLKGFQGVHCEYDVNECLSLPCHNGGTCINLLNRFFCSCPPGTRGAQCEVNVDECATERGPRCMNGGTCLDGIGGYICSCPPGFTGKHCEGDINECLSSPCHAPGSLDCVQLDNRYECRCRFGYTGDHCESMVDLCLSKPCHNRGECRMNVSSGHGYTCICPPGYTGFNCGDSEVYSCANLQCQNGGTCYQISGQPQCHCTPGYSGARCDLVQTCPCQNGGSCIRDPQNPYRICQCPLHFSGRLCETPLLRNMPTCPYVQCEQMSRDGVCDPQCKNQECLWDGGDCSLHWPDPWKYCSVGLNCWDLFHNGHCDPECDNPGCLFDGFECRKNSTGPASRCKYDDYCADHYANGHCNQGCNTEACGWDGLDCSSNTPSRLADGALVIVVLLQPEELKRDMKGFLRSLGALLRTNLQIRRDVNQNLMVYPYYGDEQEDGATTMKRRGKRELGKEVIGSKVYLEIDNRQCAQGSTECFSRTDQAASFIAAESLKLELPYPIVSVNSTNPPSPPPNPLWYLVAVAVAIGLLILMLGVLAAKRKRKHGILWLPDGFLPNSNNKRREPVGQDDFSLKSLQKPQDGALADGSQSHRWPEEEHPSKKPRVRWIGVDHREWTLQHRKAADISLTPPQADLDTDCLDVNVKGPDGFTPLMLASLRSSGIEDDEEDSEAEEPGSSVISDLIAQGATLMAQTDRTGETALHLAARYSRADAAKRLLDAGADANAHDNMGRTPLHAAVAADAQGVFQILIRNRATDLDARMNDGTTPLILAARLAVEGMVEELVHCHADVNAVDDHGKSALHWAAAVNNVEATLVLLKNGANRDMQDNKEETPLFLAAREGSFEAAQVLLDHYSNRDITDHLDRLPRDTAQERMHHDIVRLLDQYNLVHSPHTGPGHVGGPGHSSLVCGNGGNGFIGMRSGPQGKKNRRGGGKVGGVGGGTAKEQKDMKAKRRKKPPHAEGPAVVAVGGNGGTKAAGLPESSVTMSPVDSLESPHSYTGDAAAASTATATSPALLASPTSRPLLPPVSHVLGNHQQSWVGMNKHTYGGHVFGLLQHQMGAGHHTLPQHHSPQGMLTPMNVTMSREQLPPIVTFQMMAPGGGQPMMKQAAAVQMQGQALAQQGAAHLHCTPGLMYQMPHPLTHQHSHSMGVGMVDGQGRQVAPYQQLQSPVDKYPTPPSQHSYPASGSEGTTPGHPAQPPNEHPYLTPSPESPDPWSSSSPHSNSDWSDVTTSPTPLGNPHTLAPPRHTHIPDQAQLQPPAQPQAPQSQQPQPGSVYA
uniref:Notch receptor 2 n=1 Tax=Denticeps clupeoides TaxID=299321 RepID=A0AAY4E0N6_9TELE